MFSMRNKKNYPSVIIKYSLSSRALSYDGFVMMYLINQLVQNSNFQGKRLCHFHCCFQVQWGFTLEEQFLSVKRRPTFILESKEEVLK